MSAEEPLMGEPQLDIPPLIKQSSSTSSANSSHLKFPFAAFVYIILILLSTIQVYVIVSSPVYLRSQLVRSFLSVYYDDSIYPQLFMGKAYYTKILNISQLSNQLIFSFDNINEIKDRTFVNCSYQNSSYLLKVHYNLNGQSNRQLIYKIDPQVGIIQPFNMNNITSIQLFLLDAYIFELQISNVIFQSDGFRQTYKHTIKYQYQQQSQIANNFHFQIDSTQSQNNQDNHPQITYIIYLRILDGVVFLLASIALYLNYKNIRQIYKFLDQQLGLKQYQIDADSREDRQKRAIVKKRIQSLKIISHQLKFQHYFLILDFDIIFSSLSNVFQILGSFYLLSGLEKEKLVGIGCLFAWLTIFKFIKKRKKLVLMYQVIKLSLIKITFFFLQFLPVFIGYALLGICLFPKVSFFSSLDDSVTTLVSLMMGDSITQITDAIVQKNSTFEAIVFIFCFVLLFMHAIHNTLTSLIKQYFVLKKLQFLQDQKQKNNHQNYIYIQETKIASEQKKADFPLLVTPQFALQLLKMQIIKLRKKYNKKIMVIFQQFDKIIYNQKWLVVDYDLEDKLIYKKQLTERLQSIQNILQKEKNILKYSQLTD